MGERGWAARLLEWGWDGALLRAEVSVGRYYIRGERHEVVAWGELRDVGGRHWIEIGSFASVGAARAACERDAVARCRREREDRGPVDVRIAAGRRRAQMSPCEAAKGRELGGGNYRPRDRDPREALDAALAAFMPVIEDRG
jgi:hypothetical protein